MIRARVSRGRICEAALHALLRAAQTRDAGPASRAEAEIIWAASGKPASMEEDRVHNARIQNGMRDARTHVNRQKGQAGIEPPRTVAEQLDELVSVDENGTRRRDPVRAAQMQHTQRDNGVGGALIDTSQSANGAYDDIVYEKLPGRHERKADERTNT